MTACLPLVPGTLDTAKWSFTTRRVSASAITCLVDDLSKARSGDLVLGRVAAIGSHKRIQLRTGRGADLYIGDHVVLACGDRYAPDQFEGVARLDPDGADMLASGGVLGHMRHRNQRMAAPTRIVPLGLLGNASGQVVNVEQFALDAQGRARPEIVIGVVGTSMNSGKTTAAASLIHGLERAGHRVAAIKATGTGAYGDFNAYTDAGASSVLDFLDCGMVSTYLQPVERIGAALNTLLAQAAESRCRVAVVELADGVYQRETAALLGTPEVLARFDAFLFAVADPVSAVGGVAELSRLGIAPFAITGMLSRSPLGRAEAEAQTGVAVIPREHLMDPALATALMHSVQQSKRPACPSPA